MKFQIADTIVEMINMHHLIDMPLYSNFTMPDNTPTDIKIEILDAIECSYHIDKKILKHNTYIWTTQNNELIMIFSSRGTFLDESSIENIWILITNGCKQKWNLYIPRLNVLSGVSFNMELQKRPWLQRLLIMYYMYSNTAVLHGALCNIDGEGCLFLGESGVGKSTMCSILDNKYDVYSDDRLIVKIHDKKLMAYGTPWNIKNNQYCLNRAITIKRIYFLSHGENSLKKVKNNFSLLTTLMKQILHSNIYASNDLFDWKFNIANKIITNCSQIYKFSFVPDDTCIKYVSGDINV